MRDFTKNQESVAWSAFNVFEKQSHDVTDALLYCRVSSKSQVKRGHGLESQETRLREFCKYKKYNVIDKYADDLTGKTSDRKGVKELLAFLRRHKSKKRFVVLIDDITRFARSVRAHEDLRDAIIAAGGIIESPSVEFGHDADSRMIEYMLATVSQHQREKNAEQTVNRMRSRLLNGYWCYQPPIGYKHRKVEGHGKLICRDEPLASILQEALEGFASGRFDTQVEVKRFLETQPDFPKDLPNGEVRNQKITDILTRVVYAGMVEAPKWDVSLRVGKHEGLISFATYEKIQQRLSEGAKTPARKDMRPDFPLRGAVVCGDCNKPLTAYWAKGKTKRHPYYECYSKNCGSRRKAIRRDVIEGEFEALLGSLQPTEGMFELVKSMFKDGWNGRLQQGVQLAARLRANINAVEQQVDQLLDRIVDTSNPNVIAAIEKRIGTLQRDKLVAEENLSKAGQPLRPFDEMFELSLQFLANPLNLWRSEQFEDKRAVLRLTFSERLVYVRNEGFRTPKTTLPFKALGSICEGEKAMARLEGETLNQVWFELESWRCQLKE